MLTLINGSILFISLFNDSERKKTCYLFLQTFKLNKIENLNGDSREDKRFQNELPAIIQNETTQSSEKTDKPIEQLTNFAFLNLFRIF